MMHSLYDIFTDSISFSFDTLYLRLFLVILPETVLLNITHVITTALITIAHVITIVLLTIAHVITIALLTIAHVITIALITIAHVITIALLTIAHVITIALITIAHVITIALLTILGYLDTWSGFEAVKTAPWQSRGLHHFGKFLEPSDE